MATETSRLVERVMAQGGRRFEDWLAYLRRDQTPQAKLTVAMVEEHREGIKAVFLAGFTAGVADAKRPR